jgi:glycerol-1-phosphate dehydrogenase [NAD(P)+]
LSSDIHRMQLPREIIVGNGSLQLVSKICRRLGFSESVLIITGPTTKHIAAQKVADLLQDKGLEVNCHVVSSDIPTLIDVKQAEEVIQKLKPQVVFGVGGGTKIDIAKLSSARKRVPFISVPTSASHDGMASPFASIKGLDRPYSIKAQSPMAVIADTEVIINVPYRFIASGCADVVSKFTSTRDWKLAHEKKSEYYAQYTASLALMSAQHIVENADLFKPGSEEGLRVLLEALVSCGVAMCIGGTSKPCSGSEHLFSHALDLVAPNQALHGEECGLGAIMMAYLHGIEWETIRDTLKKVGAPVTAKEIGIQTEHIVEALLKAPEIRPERYTILNEKRLTPKTAYELAKITGVAD